jgi:hypothetical protein
MPHARRPTRIRSLAAAGVDAAASASVSVGQTAELRCAGPAYRQFDFWLGDWDAYDADAPGVPAARVQVDEALGGCVVRERYDGADGLVGESLSVYDASRGVWHQTWVTNRGHLLVLEGEFRDGRMTLLATEATPNGPLAWRGVWIPADGGVREKAETSSDGGRSWKLRFDMVFRRHGSIPSPTPTPRAP